MRHLTTYIIPETGEPIVTVRHSHVRDFADIDSVHALAKEAMNSRHSMNLAKNMRLSRHFYAPAECSTVKAMSIKKQADV